jgi:hypothetical protein
MLLKMAIWFYIKTETFKNILFIKKPSFLRVYGYDRIPTDEIPRLEIVSDITPKKYTTGGKNEGYFEYIGIR